MLRNQMISKWINKAVIQTLQWLPPKNKMLETKVLSLPQSNLTMSMRIWMT